MLNLTSPPSGPEGPKIQKMFSEIAGRYDLANTVLSLGIHHIWRKALVSWSGATGGQKVLDCATGTGDLAIEFKKAVGPTGQVIGTDFCAEMMTTAPAKAQAKKLIIQFAQADVLQLPYPDSSFDIASISFGIRNVENPVRALQELARVVKPGGVVMVLEFGQPRLPGIGALYEFYSNVVLPKLGGFITGQPQAYKYLQQSSAKFPCGDEFLELAERSGSFQPQSVKNGQGAGSRAGQWRSLSLGIAYMYKLSR
jgi:demethylmenaquinone methyltransferase/2-methoxy-6-polyprenyl-1,4-benzoquinol methylase